MKILIADKLSDTAVNTLQSEGFTVLMDPDLTAETLPEAISIYDVLVVRSTKVTKETIEKGEKLSLIIRAGAGINTIDLATASRLGIHVANCPGKNTAAVAELVMGLMIAADRRIADATADLRAGKWNKKLYSKASGIKGRTISIIGFGAIGRAVADRSRSFDMSVAAWSRSLTPERAEELDIEYCATPLDAAAKASVVTVHLAASADTTHFIGTEFFEEMQDGAIFINTSRGEIVDTAALKKAISSKGIKAALDVYEDEPAATSKDFKDLELAGMITGTHHIGASTDEATEAIAAETVRIIKVYRETGTPPNAVNLREKSPAEISLVVRHFNRVGVLANVLDEIRTAGINIEEMQNSIFEENKAAVCTIKLDDMPNEKLISRIAAEENIINVSIK